MVDSLWHAAAQYNEAKNRHAAAEFKAAEANLTYQKLRTAEREAYDKMAEAKNLLLEVAARTEAEQTCEGGC